MTKFTTAPPPSTTLVPSKTTPTKPSTTASCGNGVETPEPIQPGMSPPSCSGLWADAWVFVSVIGHTATPTQSTKPTNGIETPSPIQAGITKSCNKFHLVKSTTTCNSIKNYYKIPLKDFDSWNPAVGTNCQSLLIDYWVCVGVVGWTAPTPTTPSNGITTPTPIRTCMTKNCNNFHTIKSITTYASIQDY
ncbi:Autolysin [Fusarium agapanthi]|uniref:Autolysin n=1 Tax=Fusarium agapanthi TaxID=1803897 RepID=A0A9P5B490_9HYPO|nr:Autolysin [Fusarium agapanthi]